MLDRRQPYLLPPFWQPSSQPTFPGWQDHAHAFEDPGSILDALALAYLAAQCSSLQLIGPRITGPSSSRNRLQGRGLGRRDDVLFDPPNPCNVLRCDTQRQPLLFGLVIGKPEMHDAVLDDDVSCPDLEPTLSLEPFLSHQLGEQLFTNGAVVVIDLAGWVAPCRRQR